MGVVLQDLTPGAADVVYPSLTQCKDAHTASLDPQLTLVFFDNATASSWTSKVSGFWPSQLLPQDFPAANILHLDCCPTAAEMRSSCRRSVRAADALLTTLLELQVPEQVVLVGHGFGGHLMKEVCLEIQRRTCDPSLPPADRHHCRSVLASISGAVFYSTPHRPLPRLALPEYEYVLPDVQGVCSRFRSLCRSYGWRTAGLGAAIQGPPNSSVSLQAAAKGMDLFYSVPADQEGISRPASRTHPAYAALCQILHVIQQQQSGSPLQALPALTAVKAWRMQLSRFLN